MPSRWWSQGWHGSLDAQYARDESDPEAWREDWAVMLAALALECAGFNGDNGDPS